MFVEEFQRGRLSTSLDEDLGRRVPSGVVEPLRGGVEKLEELDSMDSLDPKGRRPGGARLELLLLAEGG